MQMQCTCMCWKKVGRSGLVPRCEDKQLTGYAIGIAVWNSTHKNSSFVISPCQSVIIEEL